MTTEPTSILTLHRPDIWQHALLLATSVTGYKYAPKLPLPDGTIYACGGQTPTPAQQIKDLEEQISEYRREIKYMEKTGEETYPGRLNQMRGWLAEATEKLKRLREAQRAGAVAVTGGAMEWLLHEVGHWVAATPEERALLNYGLADDIAGTIDGFEKIIVPTDYRADREWGAWAFEEIVLAPWGPARLFAPPTQADGVVFCGSGTMPAWALRHAERQMCAEGVDVEAWRAIFGEWIRFERSRPIPSWQRVS